MTRCVARGLVFTSLAVAWAFGLWNLQRLTAAEEAAKPKAPAAGKKDTDGDAKKADPEAGFVRILRDDRKRPLEMQTAIVRYAKPGDASGMYVDLIGAVHVGDTGYYKQLNKQFTQYDALLYELVAPRGKAVPKKGTGSSHPVGMVQQGMKDVLDLDYQLDCINYRKKNFVHADMSPDDFSKSMEDRGETMWTIIFRMMGQSIAQQSQHPERNSEAELLAALFSPNRALALKRAIAQQFEDLESSMNIFDGPDGSVIITERNKVALDVLKKEIGEGKKKLGIFYGAGHLADMEKRLESDFGLKRQSVKWLTAWDLRDKPKSPKS